MPEVPLAYLAMPLVFALLDGIALIACITFRKVSPRMPLLMLGFGGQSALGMLSLAGQLLSGGVIGFGGMQIGHVLFAMLIVVGLAVVLNDVHSRLDWLERNTRRLHEDPTEPLDEEEDTRSWRPRRPGSEDIRE